MSDLPQLALSGSRWKNARPALIRPSSAKHGRWSAPAVAGRVWDGNEAATAVLADGKSAGRIEHLRHHPIEPLTPQPMASAILPFETNIDCSGLWRIFSSQQLTRGLVHTRCHPNIPHRPCSILSRRQTSSSCSAPAPSTSCSNAQLSHACFVGRCSSLGSNNRQLYLSSAGPPAARDQPAHRAAALLRLRFPTGSAHILCSLLQLLDE